MVSFRLATIVLLVAGIIAAYNSAFTVNQTQQALVLQLGEPKRTIQEPGLAFKLPFIQDVTYYEKRVLSLIPQDAQEVILSCLLYTSPSPRDATLSRMPSSA